MIHYAVPDASGNLVFDFPSQQRAYCLKTFGAGTCLDVEIREHRDKRSDRQNKAMWALLHEWCEQADKGWRPDDLKDDVMGIVFGTFDITSPLTGKPMTVPAKVRTSGLNVSEFCKVIEGILELAAEKSDIYLMAPDEYRKAKENARKQAAKAAKTGG